MEVPYKEHLIRLDPTRVWDEWTGELRWVPRFAIYRVGSCGPTFIFASRPVAEDACGAPEEALSRALAKARRLVDRVSGPS